MATASTQDSPPPKAHAFGVVVPVGTSADDLIDGVSAIVGLPEVFSAQHLGGTNFQVVVNTRAAVLKLREAGSVSIANQSVPIVPTGPQVTNVTCLFLPTFVRNDQLVQALAPYGKVIDVSYATYHRTATVKTGTRFIRMEMKEANPLPNFLRVAGHRATFDYRGLKRVCRRCRQEGHVRAQCTTGYCDRCGVFGHPTEDCTANCRRCGGTHATVDCTAKRSYSSMVAGNYATDFPALDRGNSTSPIAPEAPAVPPVSTVDPPSPPDAAAAAPPPPPPSAPPSAPPEPSPTGSGATSGEGTDSVRAATVVVGDTAYAAWSPASGDCEVSSDSDHLVIDENPAPGSQCIPRGVNFTRLSEPRLVVVKNGPLLLQCSVSSLPELAPVNITWNHDGVPQQLGSVLPNGSLLIERVAHHKKKNGRKDDGDYSCLAHTNAGIMFSPPVQVKVARMAKGFTEEPRPVNAPVGGIARFACHIGAVPPAHYTWQRNLEDLPFGDPRFTQLSSGILQIINTTASDAGNYRCIAKNIAKTMQSAEAALTVPPTVHHEQPPEFLSPPSQELTSVVGETVEFECLLRSSLHPVITWLREGFLPLPEGRSFIVGQGNLRIEKLKRSDAGRYQCLVNFTRGTPQALTSLSQSHTLVVHEPPSFTAELASLVSPAARTVRFECDTQGFPAPEVRWFKDGKPLIINGRIKVLHSEDNKYLPEDRRHVTEEADHHRRKPPNHMLVISHLVRRDAGFYQCVASNPAGTSTLAARLQVNASGDAPSPPSDLTARTLSSTSILLSWSPPHSPGNRVVQAYSVHYLPTSGGIELQKVSVNTSCIVDKLTAFTNYTFYVRAYSGKSASEQSEEITQITGEDVPLAAPSVSVTSLTPTTMHISWSELSPSVARGFIALYRIHYRLHDQNYNHVMEVKGNVREYTITGLEPTKQYSVRVMAGTVQGFPHLSDEEWPWVTYRMPDGFSSSVPLPPSLYLSVVNSTTLEARWSLLPEEKSAISGFKLRLREQGSLMTEPIVLPNSSFSYVLYDLKPQTWYEVHVLCFSNFGDGQEAVQTVLTHPENLTAEGDIDPPGGLEAEPTSSRSIHLSWRAPVPAQNISYYTVRYSAVRPKSVHNSSMVQYIPSTKTEVVVADLQPSTLYGFAVRSHGADSHMSHFSQLIECKTSEDKPTAPRDITWAPLDLGSIRVHWQAPEFPNGVIQSYHIFYNACEPDATQMDKWLTRSEPGTRLTSVLNGLAINTVYSLRLQAQTSAGRGPLTQVIKFVISVPSPSTSSPHPQAAGQQDEDPSLGILLGVAAGLLCMTLCAIIILYKNKKCSNTNEDSTSEGRLASRSCFATLFSRRKTPATPRELELLSSPPNASEDHLDTKGGYPQCNGKTNGHAKDKRLRDVTLNGHVGNGSAVHITNSSPPCYNNRDPESRLPLPRSQHRYDASDCFLQTEGGPWTEGRTSAPTPLLGDHSSAAWRDIEEPTMAAEEEQATLETIVSADNSFVSHRDVASDTTNTSVHPEA